MHIYTYISMYICKDIERERQKKMPGKVSNYSAGFVFSVRDMGWLQLVGSFKL